MAGPTPQPPGRLVSQFANRPQDQQASGWTELWDSDEYELWDRGKPSPALIDFIESRPSVLPKPKNKERLKVLIPGCGKGYDVAMLALHGFDVYGLEISQKGAEVAEQYGAKELEHPSDYNYANKADWQDVQRGEMKLIAGDFFKRDWEAACLVKGFDIIYDYTFLCALLPSMRKDWARRMHELLGPEGVLICLEFPLYKDLKLPGPPWGLKGVHWNLLAEGGDGMIEESQQKEEDGSGAFKRLAYIKPERTYEVSQGTDRLSVWGLK